jgi:hypothetical protein
MNWSIVDTLTEFDMKFQQSGPDRSHSDLANGAICGANYNIAGTMSWFRLH